jgi:hypothetical protein
MKLDESSMNLLDEANVDARTGRDTLDSALLEAMAMLEKMGQEGAYIGVIPRPGSMYPMFRVQKEYVMPRLVRGMLYGLLLIALPAVAPELIQRGDAQPAAIPAADFLPKVRDIMKDAEKVDVMIVL